MNHSTISLTLLLPVLLLGGCGTTPDRDASEQLVRPPVSTVAPAEQLEKPDLTGNWLLNREQSDDAKKLVAKLFKGGRGNRGDRRADMGGERNGRRAEQAGNMQGSEDSESTQRGKASRGPQKLREFIDSAELLAIKHHDPALLISTGRYSKQIYTDMRSTPVSAKGSLDQKVFIAYWKGDVLTVETTVDPATRVFQYYKLHESSRQLWISTSIQMQTVERPVFFNTVYDIATSSESRGIMM